MKRALLFLIFATTLPATPIWMDHAADYDGIQTPYWELLTYDQAAYSYTDDLLYWSEYPEAQPVIIAPDLDADIALPVCPIGIRPRCRDDADAPESSTFAMSALFLALWLWFTFVVWFLRRILGMR